MNISDPAPPAPGRRTIPLQAAAPEAGGDSPPSLSWLLAAPHRLFFFLGMLGLLTASAWWLLQLLARSAGVALPMAVPPSWVHGWAMLSGFMPFFIFGFLFTAGPKWLNLPGPEARSLLPLALLAATGLAVALAGAHLHALLAAGGIALLALGWALLAARFARLLFASRADDRLHASLVLLFIGFGVLAQAAYARGFATTSAGLVHSAEMMMLWWMLAPVYVTVAHRLIPFFTSSALPFLGAWRPLWLLTALLGVVVLHALLPVAAALLPARGWWLARALVDAAGGLLVLYVGWRWGAVQSLKNRLLAMLHLGFLWLGVALLLYAAAALAQFAGRPDLALGQAPLHALTMGFLGSVLLAMVTRVTAGHGGRKLVADGFNWALFLLLQAAVAVRVVGDAWPAARSSALLLAIALWCAAVMPWALRALPIYLRRRQDGRPG